MAMTKKQMEEKDAVEDVTTEENQKTVVDEWKDMRKISLPRGAAGEAKSVYVSINSHPAYMVPRGKEVEVPYPVYERLQIMLEAEDKTAEIKDEIDRENKENMNSTISWGQ